MNTSVRLLMSKKIRACGFGCYSRLRTLQRYSSMSIYVAITTLTIKNYAAVCISE